MRKIFAFSGVLTGILLLLSRKEDTSFTYPFKGTTVRFPVSVKEALSIMLLTIFITSCLSKAEKELYLIPNGYKGAIVLIFNAKKILPKQDVDNNRVYTIPQSGIFITNISKNYGIIDKNFYYFDNKSKLKLSSFNLYEVPKYIDSSKTYVFYGKGFNINYQSHKQVQVEILIVSSLRELDSILNGKLIKKLTDPGYPANGWEHETLLKLIR